MKAQLECLIFRSQQLELEEKIIIMQFIYFIKLEIMQYFNKLNNAHVEILKIQVYKILKFTLCQNSCSVVHFHF